MTQNRIKIDLNFD